MDPSQSVWIAVLYWTYIACLAYYIGINTYYAVLFIFSIIENRFRVFQQHHEDFHNISRSLMTLPVSVVVPAYNESPGIARRRECAGEERDDQEPTENGISRRRISHGGRVTSSSVDVHVFLLSS